MSCAAKCQTWASQERLEPVRARLLSTHRSAVPLARGWANGTGESGRWVQHRTRPVIDLKVRRTSVQTNGMASPSGATWGVLAVFNGVHFVSTGKNKVVEG
jgi:hypothetical protein